MKIKMFILWLGLLTAALSLFLYWQGEKIKPENLIQASEPRDYGAFAQMNGLAYLNYLRKQAGVNELAHSEMLEQSARNHARYLTEYPDEGHDEHHRDSRLFTGERVLQRSGRVGYLYQGVQENVSTGELKDLQGLPKNFGEIQQLDGLMTAIYHRFSLLGQGIDEAGVAYEEGKTHKALAVNQGSRRFNQLCALARMEPEPGRSYYKEICHNGAVVYEDEISRRETQYVVWPVGNSAQPDFHGERPEPMPGHELTGNPVSVAFSDGIGKVEMRSFKLYQGDEEVAPVRILTQYNDPNHKFSAHEFALFPLRPLTYDSEYRAVFEYEHQGEIKNIEWRFRTKRPDLPYFIVKGGEQLAVSAGKQYFIHWQNFWCMSDCPNTVYRTRGGAEMKIIERQPGGLVVQLGGKPGGTVQLMPEHQQEKAVLLYVQN